MLLCAQPVMAACAAMSSANYSKVLLQFWRKYLLYLSLVYFFLSLGVYSFVYFDINLASICSKLNPLVSGTVVTINKRAMTLMSPKMMKVQVSPTQCCNGANAKATTALEPKLIKLVMLSARPLVRMGKISDTMSHEIGPNETW